MKTREQKIRKAVEIRKHMNSYQSIKYIEIKDRIDHFIYRNCNNPDFFIDKCDFKTMSVDELYEGFMRTNIIYL